MSQASNPDQRYLIAYGPNANCTLEICPVSRSLYRYRPSLAANAIFLTLFGIVMLMHLWRGIKWKEWFYTTCMVLGCVIEVIGYGGRIMLYQNPFSFTGFMVQICMSYLLVRESTWRLILFPGCLTFAPVFFSAGLYILFSRIVVHLDPTLAHFPPRFWYWIFVPCDLIALALQAAGGAMSSSSTGKSGSAISIALAGLSFQVITLFVFCVLCVEYSLRYWRKQKRLAREGVESGMAPTRPEKDPKFKLFAWFLIASIIFIFIRCAYRIAELKDGYSGRLIRDQGTFIALEGVMILCASITLLVAHPGPAFAGGNRDRSGRVMGRDETFEKNNQL